MNDVRWDRWDQVFAYAKTFALDRQVSVSFPCKADLGLPEFHILFCRIQQQIPE